MFVWEKKRSVNETEKKKSYKMPYRETKSSQINVELKTKFKIL